MALPSGDLHGTPRVPESHAGKAQHRAAWLCAVSRLEHACPPSVKSALYVENPVKFARSHGVNVTPGSKEPASKDIHILVIEGFLLYNYKPLIDLFDIRYYLAVPYDGCKRRRSTRNYTVPDPPGLFDGHVWPMYLKHRKEMEDSGVDGVYLDEQMFRMMRKAELQNS
ncbi:hypothetical protein QYF61_026109 [Mycteria americana]|uniref:Nicotinamide riboside kinase 2 n=1 Tax=Mycteria americana TaxID=33587 RepID=A0AAN7RYE9_MYCAM|nr:hypothetical protein QYF61_026109 [Mycteria americana]